MGVFGLMVACLLAQADGLPRVGGATLSGQSVDGELVRFTGDTIRLKTPMGERDLATGELLELRIQPAPPSRPVDPRRTVVTLTDGSRLSATVVRIVGTTVELDGIDAAPIKLPVSAVIHMQFGKPAGKAAELWSELLAKETRKDLLVIRKGETADYLSGLVGEMGEKLSFTLDGEVVPVAREKVLGFIYARRPAPRQKPAGFLILTGGDRLATMSVEPKGAVFVVQTPAGAKIDLPARQVEAFDFTFGKLEYLSNLTWRSTRYTPYIQNSGDREDTIDRELFQPRKDRGLFRPLSLGGKVYRRGVWLHSKSTVSWRLSGEYRRFQSVIGIDDQVEVPTADVDLKIMGDERVLFEGIVKWGEAPRPIDLDVSGVRDLEIQVGFGPTGRDWGDQLVFGDAKLIK